MDENEPASSPPESPVTIQPLSSPCAPPSSPYLEPLSSPVREPISSPPQRSRSSSPLSTPSPHQYKRKKYETFDPVPDPTKKYWPPQEDDDIDVYVPDENQLEGIQQDYDHQQQNNFAQQYVLTSSSEESSSSSSEDAVDSESSSEDGSVKSSSSESDSEKSENGLNDSDDSDSNEQFSPKVYDGCSLTVDEGVLNMMDLFVKHKMEKVQIGVFEMKCPLCYGDSHKFYQLSVSDQIRNLFENHGLADLMDKYAAHRLELDLNILTDLCDGSEFKRAKIHEPYSLTLLGHTDGISISDSSDVSLWPLEYVIAELPPSLRFKFVLVSGIWIDNSKPYLNTFMKPFVKELQDINRDGGVKWIHPKSKEEMCTSVSVAAFAVDAPARALLQNILSHGGKHCCNICEQKMKKLPEQPVLPGVKKSTRRRVFTFEEEASTLRTAERMDVQGKEARRRQEQEAGRSKLTTIRGVRGISVAAELPGCDRSTMVFPEYMHLLLCLVKEFFSLWFEKEGPWILKDYQDIINSYLESIRVPDFVTRIPRSTEKFHQWKANELRSFVLYYSVIVLRRCMKEEYFQHWLLLVLSLYLLLQDTVSPIDISRSEIMLQLFCRDFARLYKADYFTYYVHNLLHLPLTVKRNGPLWSNSTFQFESFNGTFAKFIHGTKNQGKELVNNVRLTIGVEVLKARVNNSHLSDDQHSAVEFRGKVKKYVFTDREKLLLSSHNVKTSVQLYFRALTKGQTFATSIYQRQKKRNNFTVCYVNSYDERVFGEIKLFLESPGNVKMALIESFKVNHLRSFHHTDSGMVIKHIIPIEKTDDIHLVEISKLLFKVIRINDFVCLRPNKYEVNL
ncbi:Ankyrin repeat domain-containing protein 17 [Frankliniella fusca]|nr:Ankyrin repeat domain-containing protein 17 [Frankliniella fusca]KAK3928143.1 Ankyrin repeat domain-containing protein 17 [Frankliniella fusca]